MFPVLLAIRKSHDKVPPVNNNLLFKLICKSVIFAMVCVCDVFALPSKAVYKLSI